MSVYGWVLEGLIPCFWCVLAQCFLFLSFCLSFIKNKTLFKFSISIAWVFTLIAWITSFDQEPAHFCLLAYPGFLEVCNKPVLIYGISFKLLALLAMTFLLVITGIEQVFSRKK
jgi:hypothetical protein